MVQFSEIKFLEQFSDRLHSIKNSIPLFSIELRHKNVIKLVRYQK